MLKPHIVVLPCLAQGHLIPFWELAKLLATQGLRVSYISTPANVSRFQFQLDKAKAQQEALDLDSDIQLELIALPMPILDGVPEGHESTDTLTPHIDRVLILMSHKLAEPFEHWLAACMDGSASAPLAIISDAFAGWVQDISAKFDIPTIVFHTVGAYSTSLLHSLLVYTPQKNVQSDDDYFVLPDLSFQQKLCKSELLSIELRDPKEENMIYRFFRRESIRSMEGWGLLFNSFYDMEGMGIDHIKSLTGTRPVWSIGPLLLHPTLRRSGVVERGKVGEGQVECLQWLDGRIARSVLYICFGSQIYLSRRQIHALAEALESSEQCFMWVIRRSPRGDEEEEEEDVLPEEFEERTKTKNRGMIIHGWAPQLLILSHRSIGGFMSHCGWNSIIESVSVGVPMITWPMYADQPFNSKLVVEHLGMGIQVCAGKESVPNVQSVRNAVTLVLAEEEGIAMRSRALELKELANKAVEKGGSSHRNLQSFVEQIRKLHRNCHMSD
eukprot:Gb_35486 [translate_table: standard]